MNIEEYVKAITKVPNNAIVLQKYAHSLKIFDDPTECKPLLDEIIKFDYGEAECEHEDCELESLCENLTSNDKKYVIIAARFVEMAKKLGPFDLYFVEGSCDEDGCYLPDDEDGYEESEDYCEGESWFTQSLIVVPKGEA